MKVTYTEEQRKHAIKTFKRLKSYSKTIRVIGYPSLHTLYDWVGKRSRKSPTSNPHRTPKHYPWTLKLEAVNRSIQGEDIRDIAQDLSIVSYPSIYKWIRLWRVKGVRGLMTKQERISEGVYKTKAQLKQALPDDVDELKDLAAKLLAEKAVLEEELKLSKKLPGGIPEKLSAKHKTQIVNNLRNRLPLALLFEVLDLKPSSYYYALWASKQPDKYEEIRPLIHEISQMSSQTYGSPRIWIALRQRGVFISEKVVRRLMKEEHIKVYYATRRKKFISYIGEITPAAKDCVQRNFHAKRPNTLWLTDISEFAAPDSKIYLSPMIDCFDGKVVSWQTSKHPDYQLVESMLNRALNTLTDQEKRNIKSKDNPHTLTIHTDRGGHYRGGRWIETLNGKGIIRSMSRKGNSGDNAACEGFFGRMKAEMYYGRKWSSSKELEQAINDYLDFYNNQRIKVSLGGITIKRHREMLAKMYRK